MNDMKAWQVEEPYEGNATIVFAKTINKAKYLAVQYDEFLQEYGYAEVRAIRRPELDKYAGDKPHTMNFSSDEDRLIMVRDAGFRCIDPDYDDCKKCIAKDYCGEYQDYLENREDEAT